MKAYNFGLTILTSCLALAAACTKQAPNAPNVASKTDRLVTIQAGATLGCEVDYPIAVAYTTKHYPRWLSADNEYWIHFVGQTPFPPGVDPIDVPANNKSKQLDITGPPMYYKYEIWSQYEPSTGQHKKCKDADDDHDTGLNVKR